MAWHFDVVKMVNVLQTHFHCPRLRYDAIKHIESCYACTIAKPTTMKYKLYTPLPNIDWPSESISMDHMSCLPLTKHGNDSVFMVVDWFSNMTTLTPRVSARVYPMTALG